MVDYGDAFRNDDGLGGVVARNENFLKNIRQVNISSDFRYPISEVA